MRGAGARLLYGIGRLLWIATWPFLAIGQVAIWCGLPFRWVSNLCVDKAREWDPRLSARGQPLDLRPPPQR